jgi:benzoyl-CoA reductase subunit D
MARAVHDAIASRVVSMVRRVGHEPPVALIGGLARNTGFVDSLGRLGLEQLVIPEHPELVGALGAALAARDA